VRQAPHDGGRESGKTPAPSAPEPVREPPN
jgi:hypothetical protein